MTEIINIRVPTKYNIDIYSTISINNYNLYYKVLDESDFNIRLFYANDSDFQEFNIKTLLTFMNIITKPNKVIDYEININSSNKHCIFELIDLAYIQKYNSKIYEHNIYKKYNDITNKIKNTQLHINNITKSFDSISLANINEYNINKMWEYIFDKLNNEDCRIIEHIMYKKLDDIINIYNEVLNKQKERVRFKKRELEEERIKSDKLKEEELKRKEYERLKVEREIAERQNKEREERERVEALRIQAERMKLENEERIKREKEEMIKLKKEEALRLAQIKQQEILMRRKVLEEPLAPTIDPNDPKEIKRQEALRKAREKQQEIQKKIDLEKQLKYKEELKRKKIEEFEKRKVLEEKRRIQELEQKVLEYEKLKNLPNIDTTNLVSQTPINTPVEINTPVANEQVILEPVAEDNNIDLVNKLLAEKQSTSNKRKKKSSSHK
jgi:hypothetical protein